MLKFLGASVGIFRSIAVPFHLKSPGRSTTTSPFESCLTKAVPERIKNSPPRPSTTSFRDLDIPYPLFSVRGQSFVDLPPRAINNPEDS